MYLSLMVLFSLAFCRLRLLVFFSRGVIHRCPYRRRRHDQPTPDDARDLLAGALRPTPLI